MIGFRACSIRIGCFVNSKGLEVSGGVGCVWCAHVDEISILAELPIESTRLHGPLLPASLLPLQR